MMPLQTFKTMELLNQCHSAICHIADIIYGFRVFSIVNSVYSLNI